MSLEGKIRVLPHLIDRAAMQLAIDAVLFKEMRDKIEEGKEVHPIFRTYRLSKPAVILGYEQKVEKRFNFEMAGNYVDLTMRDTGGGHLFFDNDDFHFSFISPNGYFGSEDRIGRYQRVNSLIVGGLRRLGVDAVLGKTSIRSEIPDGKIIAGTARKENIKVSMQQGAILTREYDFKILKLLMAREDEVSLCNKRIGYIGNLNHDMLRRNILASLPNHYILDLNLDESTEARRLVKNRYGNQEMVRAGKREADVCLIAEYTKDKEGEEETIANAA